MCKLIKAPLLFLLIAFNLKALAEISYLPTQYEKEKRAILELPYNTDIEDLSEKQRWIVLLLILQQKTELVDAYSIIGKLSFKSFSNNTKVFLKRLFKIVSQEKHPETIMFLIQKISIYEYNMFTHFEDEINLTKQLIKRTKAFFRENSEHQSSKKLESLFEQFKKQAAIHTELEKALESKKTQTLNLVKQDINQLKKFTVSKTLIQRAEILSKNVENINQEIRDEVKNIDAELSITNRKKETKPKVNAKIIYGCFKGFNKSKSTEQPKD